MTENNLRYIVLGMGKSGTTALYSAIARGVDTPVDLFFEPVDLDIVRPSDPGHALVAKVLLEKTRMESMDRLVDGFDKRVFLVRDPRDVLISRLLYKIRDMDVIFEESKLGIFLDALRCKEQHPSSRGVIELYEMLAELTGEPSYLDAFARVHQSAVRKWERLRDAYHLITYEAFIDGRTDRLSEYLGITISPNVEVAAQWRRVARSKGYGDWKHWFLERDLDYVRDNAAEFMAAFGYDADWETAEPRVIPAETTTDYVERIIEMRKKGDG